MISDSEAFSQPRFDHQNVFLYLDSPNIMVTEIETKKKKKKT